MITSIEHRENFRLYNIEQLSNIYYNLKEKYKLSGFMDNSKIEIFMEIILNNLIFEDSPTDNDDSLSDTSDVEY
jgi:hypothetical protein|tara:strand:+ start:2426 stop:2647 length:222 start_codon:yes stop_codon:yes gene_type:complete